MPESLAMKPLATSLAAIFVVQLAVSSVLGQTLARSPNPQTANSAQLDELIKKIDEQNAKIDMLSQQILKLQQEIAVGSGGGSSSIGKPGVMIGEGAPSPSASSSTSAAHTTPSPPSGNTHIVSRGETLTSIAKMHKVTVDELQKLNHIDDPLKLRAGQTIMIPGSASPSPSASAEE